MHSASTITLPVTTLLQKFAGYQTEKFCKTMDVFLGLGPWLSSKHTGMVFLRKEVAVWFSADQGTAGNWHVVLSQTVPLPNSALRSYYCQAGQGQSV